MAKRTNTKKDSTDSAFVLKLVLYLILGVQWLRIFPQPELQIPLPIGAFIGIIFASHDHFRIDRKIEYAVLIIAMLIGFWLPLGLDIYLFDTN